MTHRLKVFYLTCLFSPFLLASTLTMATETSVTKQIEEQQSLSEQPLPTKLSAEQKLKRLYEGMRQQRQAQAKQNKQREQHFIAEKNQQKNNLKQLKKQVQKKQHDLESLKKDVQQTSHEIKQLKTQLNERAHALRDLFSVWKQVATDTLVNSKNSLISSEHPQQVQQLQDMISKKSLPESIDLDALKTLLQQDIQQSAQITNFQGSVALPSGEAKIQTIQRIGPFTATASGHFLQYDSEQHSLAQASRQPAGHYLAVINSQPYQSLSKNSTIPIVIDPSRGVVFERLALLPSWQERLQQGGYIGYAIIILGLIGITLAAARWIVIARTKHQINQQIKTPEQINTNNPLGKIFAAYQNSLPSSASAADKNEGTNATENKATEPDTESLEVRLQEIVIQEMPRLDKGLGVLKLLAAVAPLLGLLGTVVGMINTFQTITLVGSADPKLMAGGISQALMTTVLGLLVAVPLLFSHSFVSSRARLVMVFLSQQSLGLIAQSLESRSAHRQAKKPVDLKGN